MTAKIKTIKSSWWEGYGYRLDCSPYLGGALEMKILLDKLRLRKDRLSSLTTGFDGGIYNGPHFVRNYVESPEHGVPFITSGSLQLADLSELPLLRKKDAQSSFLRHLVLDQGMSLISSSGTIGKMAYARSDMKGMWSSQDVMKVVPDPAKIPPGYLYAFLSSKFGIPLVASGTYGAIIQHLEPEHISDIPVPRLSAKIESEIHNLVEKGAKLRTMASEFRRSAVQCFASMLEIPEPVGLSKYRRPLWSPILGSALLERLDSNYFSPSNLDARSSFDNAIQRFGGKALGAIAEVFIPGIFKREYTEDPEYGYPYITGADTFTITPTSEKFLLRRVATQNRLLLKGGMVLIHEAGSLNGLIGNSVMVGKTLDGFACTNNMVRVVAENDIDAGYIFSALSNVFGIRLIKREAAGSAIPHIDESRISALEIPWPNSVKIRTLIAGGAVKARDLSDQANELESKSQQLLINEIESPE